MTEKACFSALMILAIVCAGPLFGQESATIEERLLREVDLDAENKNLRDVLLGVADMVGVNCVIPEWLSEELQDLPGPTGTIRGVPAGLVIEFLLRPYDLGYYISEDCICLDYYDEFPNTSNETACVDIGELMEMIGNEECQNLGPDDIDWLLEDALDLVAPEVVFDLVGNSAVLSGPRSRLPEAVQTVESLAQVLVKDPGEPRGIVLPVDEDLDRRHDAIEEALTETRLSLEFVDAPVKTVLAAIAEATGVNVVLESNTAEELSCFDSVLTISLTDATAAAALRIISANLCVDFDVSCGMVIGTMFGDWVAVTTRIYDIRGIEALNGMDGADIQDLVSRHTSVWESTDTIRLVGGVAVVKTKRSIHAHIESFFTQLAESDDDNSDTPERED